MAEEEDKAPVQTVRETLSHHGLNRVGRLSTKMLIKQLGQDGGGNRSLRAALTALPNAIALLPGLGGYKVGIDHLRAGDLILSVTEAEPLGIRDIDEPAQTLEGAVVQAALYLGNNRTMSIVDALVTLGPLVEAVIHNGGGTIVAFRYLHPLSATKLITKAEAWNGQTHGSKWAEVQRAFWRLDESHWSELTGDKARFAQMWLGQVYLGISRPPDDPNSQQTGFYKFYIALPIIEALQEAGAETGLPEKPWAENQTTEMRLRGDFGYLGHLKP